jgi:two-component system NarL family response regulator
MSIEVVLVDDNRLLRQGLSWLLSREMDVAVVGEFGKAAEALEALERLEADVVVMSARLPDMEMVDAVEAVRGARPMARVLALCCGGDRQQVMAMLDAGGGGCLDQSADFMELLHAVRTIAAGGNYISPEIAGILVESYVRREYPIDENGLGTLGTRERQVLQMVAEGRTSREIANRMKVTRSTVESHRRNIMRKLNLKGVAEMTRFAIRSGLTTT